MLLGLDNVLISTSKQHVFHHQTTFKVKDAEMSDAEIIIEISTAESIRKCIAKLSERFV